MNKKDILFHKFQEYIKEEDHSSIEHILQWEYKKDDLFHMKNDEGLTLLHMACFAGQTKCLEAFLRNGANVHIRSSVGWTPLHAATLGGKLKVIEYLLKTCSADPFSKDDMGCVASDLTMDNEILHTLNKYMNEVKMKRELERLAATTSQVSKRNTYCFDLINHDTNEQQSNLTRAQSMYINPSEAEQMKERFAKSTNNRTIGGFQQTDEYPLSQDRSFTRQNSAPPTKTQNGNASSKNSNSSNVLSQLLRRTGKSTIRESRNRDSGIFDEEPTEET